MKISGLAVFLLVLVACSPTGSSQSDIESSQTPAAEATSPTSTGVASGPYARAFPDSLVQNTYQTAVDLCFYDSPAKFASEFGVSNDLEAIARAFATGSTEGAHRDAAYVGCLEGLSAPGAGQKKQFGR